MCALGGMRMTIILLLVTSLLLFFPQHSKIRSLFGVVCIVCPVTFSLCYLSKSEMQSLFNVVLKIYIDMYGRPCVFLSFRQTRIHNNMRCHRSQSLSFCSHTHTYTHQITMRMRKVLAKYCFMSLTHSFNEHINAF